jgi:hypothetical protein
MPLMPALLLAAMFNANYDCTLEMPKALRREGDKTSLTSIRLGGVDEDGLRFTASVKQDKHGLDVEIVWPSNPIQIAGKFPALPTANRSVAFAAAAGGPCMFTEAACMTLVSLVDAGDGTAKIIVMPSALASDTAADKRDPFIVVMEGKCTKAAK